MIGPHYGSFRSWYKAYNLNLCSLQLLFYILLFVPSIFHTTHYTMPTLSLIFLWQYYCDRCPFTPTETSSVGRGYRLSLTHISHLTASGCTGHSAVPSIPYPLARRPRRKGCAADIAFRFGSGSSLSALSEPPGCFRKCHIQAHVLPRAIAHYSDQSLVSRPQYAQSCRKAVRSYPFSFLDFSTLFLLP